MTSALPARHVNKTVLAMQPTPSDLTVVLADDYPVVRRGLRALLSSVEGITVVAEAASGHDAVREALLHRPDVLITELRMRELNAAAAIREVLRSTPGTAVLVFAMLEDDESVFTAMRAGARGYILKGSEQEDIVRAVRGVAAGQAIFGARIASRITELLCTSSMRARHPFPDLTTREGEVLDLIAAGMSNPAIARRLGLAPKTVSNHISAIFTKLQVTGRAEAIMRIREAGIGRASTSPGTGRTHNHDSLDEITSRVGQSESWSPLQHSG